MLSRLQLALNTRDAESAQCAECKSARDVGIMFERTLKVYAPSSFFLPFPLCACACISTISASWFVLIHSFVLFDRMNAITQSHFSRYVARFLSQTLPHSYHTKLFRISLHKMCARISGLSINLLSLLRAHD